MDAGVKTLCSPCTFAFESESAVDPKLNYIYTVSQNAPSFWLYVPPNSTNYRTSGLTQSFPITTGVTRPGYNSTAEAIDAATGKMVWSYFIPSQGYRGGMTVSGNVLYLTMSSGDLIMLNAKTGTLIKDLFIGGPLNILPSVGATASGKMQIILPMSTGTGSWGSAPGNLLSLTLLNIPTATTNTITTTILAATSTTTSVTTITAAPTGFDATTVYGISAVAVIFIVATGFLAMRGRKPGP
jgi:outer membrane protein assembly factor BamB